MLPEARHPRRDFSPRFLETFRIEKKSTTSSLIDWNLLVTKSFQYMRTTRYPRYNNGTVKSRKKHGSENQELGKGIRKHNPCSIMSSGLTFTQGLLVGQLSVVLLLGAFIKFFIFGEAPPPTRKSSSQKQYASHHRAPSLHSLASSQASPPQSLRNKASSNNILRPVPQSATDTASILRKTFYQIAPNRPQKHGQSIHQPESLDWFNVLIAQTIAQYRQTAYNLKDASPSEPPSILTSLEAAINDPTKRPSFIGEIKITEISLGEEFPIFSNVRVISVEDELTPGTRGQRLQALVDVDLSDDNLTLAIETSLILNYPKPMSAILPVALAVSVIRFSGTLSVSFVPAPPETAPPVAEGSSASRPKTNLAFSFLPDYRLDLSVRSLIGSRSRLQDVPKIAQLVEARVHAWFEERVVEPRVQVVGLPGLWPRMGKTRVRDGSDEDKRPQQESDNLMPEAQPRLRRESDHFPSQQETEALFEGLRFRNGGVGRQREERLFTREEDMRMPGALPA
jgi:maintenance of morphology protein 1